MLENITLDSSTVTASLDAYIHHCCFGSNGVFNFGKKLSCDIISNNLLKIYDGCFINQGRFFRITPGSSESIQIENGVTGQVRYDLIVSNFETNGTTEKHELKVIKGTNGGGVPKHTTGDTFNGATVNELPLYLVKLNGINIESVTKQFNLILSVQDMLDALIGIAKAGVYNDSYDIKKLMKSLDINQ
ncbi:hypothetical protein [Coprobacillus sp. AF33-1AC]|uniref:hypothetical protein n=1 Tax=Coprobacillus sp. AF33-1AC TaxID=2292032 RepID=UPI000E54C35D|nr:hypothetical protein [Coprobacillus sp. AF33-1AC]RHM59649.1 hypothetical protein DWZ53_08880 [Coprobacillus sp. AF33-1AC]